jgi:hypothetical protein
MSAALQLPMVWGTTNPQEKWNYNGRNEKKESGASREANLAGKEPEQKPDISLAFYRKHTEKMLRRYLYASMQVGRAPSILGDPIDRGWVSCRPVRTFEDAVIFVLDIERCLDKLGSLDRQLLSRIVLQEYTHSEVASLLGMCTRKVSYKFPLALDRLTEKLLENGLLILPHS